MNFMLVVCMLIMVFSIFMSYPRVLTILIMLENFNILLLLLCISSYVGSSLKVFMILMVVSTMEVMLGLVVVIQLWESSSPYMVKFY